MIPRVCSHRLFKIYASYYSELNAPRRRAASTLAAWIPEAVKDAVKSSVLEEAARKDSKLWNSACEGPAAARESAFTTTTTTNLTQPHQQRLNSDPMFCTSPLHSNMNMNMNMNIDQPIAPNRAHLLQDPLDEWHLHQLEPCTLCTDTVTDNSSYAPIVVTLPMGIQPKSSHTDPFLLSKTDMDTLANTIRSDLISIDHPVLNQVASYFFGGGTSTSASASSSPSGGKKIRPMMILLLSKAMEIHSNHSPSSSSQQRRCDIHPATRRLAEISELIHTASLFHDDVLDGADTRRGTPTVHKVFGNKMAILAGDYLLARASIFLARLRDVQVVESMSTIIEHLVRGEVMQLNKASIAMPTSTSSTSTTSVLEQRMVYYLQKNFYKTASLMANSCKSAAILGGYEDELIQSAYDFGKHLGIAFQLVDDVLDYDGNVGIMGKPPLADLNAGLATAPVLLASHVLPELIPMIERKFRLEGDVDKAVRMVRQTNAIQRTMELAVIHAEKAMTAIMALKPSTYRDSLIHLAHTVVNRSR